MNAYATFEAADFAQDAFFREWVIQPTAETDAYWEGFLREYPHQRQPVEEARLLVLALRVQWRTVSAAQSQESFRRFTEKLNSETTKAASWMNPWQLYRMAAAVTLLLAALVAGWFFYQRTLSVTYHTAYGEIRTLQLPDGSEVTLNANSTLTLPAHWEETKDREVWLDGEAFFAVTKKPGRGDARFRVHTSALDVEVLGTQFNVRNREQQTQVVLNEGKVKVAVAQTTQAESVYLQPGESVTLTSASHQLVKEQVNPVRYAAWRQRKLLLDNTPVGEVARVIEELYGVKVQFENPAVAAIVLNGTSLSTDNLDKLLHTLQPTLSVTIVREKDRIIFKK